MRAGAYTEIVDIYKVQVERNEFGEQHDTYRLSQRTRANVTDGSGQRTDENNETLYTCTKHFTMHRYVDIDEFDIIEWCGKRWRCIAPPVPSKIYNHIEVDAQLVNE